ncbi:hypothetical protein HDU98_002058, partial [Podochytrium sp. JEL0797]
MFHANKTGKKSVLILLDLCKEGKIHPPSPLRILRIALGKRCENKNRFIMTLSGPRREDKPCLEKVLHVRPDYGLHLCFECLKRSTEEVNHKRKRDQMAWPREVLLHDRSAIGGRHLNTQYILDRTFIDSTGELCGPLVTCQSIFPIRNTVMTLATKAARAATGKAKPTLEIVTPIFIQEFDKFLNESRIGKAARTDSQACKSIIKWFERVEESAKEFEETSTKRKAETKVQRVDAKKQKLASMRETVRDLVAESVDPGVAEIATTSPFYFVLSQEFRHAPSKAKKKTLANLADTLLEFYGNIPETFSEFTFLTNHCDSDTLYTDPGTPPSAEDKTAFPDFWTQIRTVATRIGPKSLLTHATNPSDHTVFSLLAANLIREATLFRCLPHLEDAFICAMQKSIDFPTLDLPSISKSTLNDLLAVKGTDKEFIASVAAMFLHGTPSAQDVMEKYDGLCERIVSATDYFDRSVNPYPKDRHSSSNDAREFMLRRFWRACGGADAVTGFKEACHHLVDGQMDVSVKRTEFDTFEKWAQYYRRSKPALPECEMTVSNLSNRIHDADPTSLKSLQVVLKKLHSLSNIFTRFLDHDAESFLTNARRFYDSPTFESAPPHSTSTNPPTTTPSGLPAMSLLQILPILPTPTNRHNAPTAESILIYRSQFREAALLNAREYIPSYFAAAAIRANSDVFSAHRAFTYSREHQMVLMGRLWIESGGLESLMEMEKCVSKVDENESANGFAANAPGWKGKGKAVDSGSQGDAGAVSESLDKANAVFVNLFAKVEPLMTRVDEFCAKQSGSRSMDENIGALRCTGVLRNVMEGNWEQADQIINKPKATAETKVQRVDENKQKLASMRETVRDLVATSVDLRVAEIATSSPFYFVISQEFMQAPSKAKKKDLTNLAETLLKFYGNSLEIFDEFSFLTNHCDSDTLYTGSPSSAENKPAFAEFWSHVRLVANRLGIKSLLTHATNPSDHIVFNLLAAVLFREAVLLRCLPHLENAFICVMGKSLDINSLNPPFVTQSTFNDGLYERMS